jgi:hypothetical protein
MYRNMWEFGAAGSVIVLVSDRKATKVVHYTLDEGMSSLVRYVSASDALVRCSPTLPSASIRPMAEPE